MYRVFNMGVGFAVILPEENASKALKIIGKHHPAQVIGRVVDDSQGKVEVKTFPGEWIEL